MLCNVIMFRVLVISCFCFFVVCFFQAEDGIRYLVRSRGLGDVYKRQQELSLVDCTSFAFIERLGLERALAFDAHFRAFRWLSLIHILTLPTSALV